MFTSGLWCPRRCVKVDKMLSRLAFRSGTFAPSVVTLAQNRLPASSATIVRYYAADAKHGHEESVKKKPVYEIPPLPEVFKYWDEANKMYFGPQRDKVNFPHPVMPLHSPPVRLGFIPESWFQFLYEKTGVTGPYVLGVGSLVFAFSKELWIIEHGFAHFLAFWLVFYAIYRKFGVRIGKYLDNAADAIEERDWHEPLKNSAAKAESAINQAEKLIWCEAGQKYVYDAKRENIDLQLESVYRQRLAEVHQAVKKRLDYQLEVDQARRRVEQQHMVQWIVDQVHKGITPQQERDSLLKCIQDLKTIAAKNPAAV